MPGKRLIICCDGTWQDSDGGTFEVPTNITRLARSVEPVALDGTPQIVYYQSGVGTEYGMLNRLIGGATGQGLCEHVREAYGFLANNYCPGDSVVLMGFSRGAYTARSIGGLINRIGILTRKGMDQFYHIYNDYRGSKLDKKYAQDLANRDNGSLVHKDSSFVTAIACFDTVGSLGIPSIGILKWRDFNQKYQFHDTGLNLGKVGYAFHALALDEHRGPFTPTLWESPPPTQNEAGVQEHPTNLRQCWFPGVHTNVGGGYDDQEIADVTLAWMVEMLQTVAGAVDFCKSYLDIIVRNEDEHSSGDWAEGKIYDSAIGIFRLTSGKYRTPGGYTPKIPGSTFGECMHSSVRVRQQRLNADPKKPGWKCHSLQGWEVVRNEATGGWKWIKRGKNGDIETELTEEPLGKMEKKIAGKRIIEKYFGKEAWDLPPDEVANKLIPQVTPAVSNLSTGEGSSLGKKPEIEVATLGAQGANSPAI